MRLPRLWALGFTGGVLAVVACSSANDPETGLGNATSSQAGSKGTAGHAGAAGKAPVAGGFGAGGATTGTGHGGGLALDAGPPPSMSDCMTMPGVDLDKDGWTPEQGDCNDCDPHVNPGAIDVLQTDASGNALSADMQVDSNCDGVKPTAAGDPSCDGSLAVGAVLDAFDAAKAMGLCNVHVEQSPADPKNAVWGVISATFGAIDSPALSGSATPSLVTDFGILDTFGAATKPQEGARVLALSSGEARTPGQPDFKKPLGGDQCHFDKGISSNFPALGTWPKQGTCPGAGDPHDGVALDLLIRVPTNATAMSFDFRFFTCEYPMFTCEQYNDVFAVLEIDQNGNSAIPASDPMFPDVAFESVGNTKNVIGVNNESFLTACKAGAAVKGNYPNCNGGADLQGSGFEGHGASAWLKSEFPVTGGSTIILRIAIWDSSDGILDSTAVIDHMHFSADPGANNGMTSTMVINDPH